MGKDLTTSNVHRKNILNNAYALQEIEQEVGFPGILFEEQLRYTKRQIAQFYDIDERTINRYLEQHETEFKENGYEVLSGKRLKEFKQAYEKYINNLGYVKDINVPTMPDDGSDTDGGSKSGMISTIPNNHSPRTFRPEWMQRSGIHEVEKSKKLRNA